ncbi:polysaccharide biosynthesis protein [Anaerosporobacter sp.]
MKQIIADKKLFMRRIFIITLDIILINISAYLALLARFNFNMNELPIYYAESILKYSLINTITTVLIFFLFRLYQSLWKYAGIDEMSNILFACVISGCIQLVGMHFVMELHVPRSYYPLSTVFMILCISGSRFMYRYSRQLVYKSQRNVKKRIMVIGAGEAGSAIIKEIINSNYVEGAVICAIDDNKSKTNRYIQGVKIVGDRSSIIENAKVHRITDIIIAMPSVPRSTLKEISTICKDTGCSLKILPGMYQLINEEISISFLRPVQIEDLLGREPIRIENKSIMDYVNGKVIMVTGGGGSIGSELCRQLANYNPKQLIIVDIYENNAYFIQQELKMKYPQLDLIVLIASVRNTKRINWIFEQYRPHIVYHAAAHKHVPLMEESPNEAIKNNVIGTYQVAKAADYYAVERFVLISSDKAVNPTNIMGASKRICEMIMQAMNSTSKTEFVSVRFGNVLGSNGSVIPLFKEQIKNGGPVTVTHPDIIRYFMTITEAVTLVLQAGAYAKGGEIFILDMGEPVKISELAENLIRLSGFTPGKDISIIYTGLRPGEKLYEETLLDEEGIQDTENNLIHIGKSIPIDKEEFLTRIKELEDASENECSDIRKLVHNIVPTYKYIEKNTNQI